MDLPQDLSAALDGALTQFDTRAVAREAERLSKTYRSGHEPPGELISSPVAALAYAVYRAPATYAAIRGAMTQAAARAPGLHPRSLLDVGSGPATGLWAATDVWPSIDQSCLVERNANMIDLGRSLAGASARPALRQTQWRRGSSPSEIDDVCADVVCAASMLGEVPDAVRAQWIDALWRATRHVLIVVEPGTPGGYSVVMSVRDHLIALGAGILAPCPHSDACPMRGNDWCHFAQRINRPEFQRAVKRASLPYEDEKYSYVAFTRDGVSPTTARVVRHPQIRPGHIRLDLCTRDGLVQHTVTKRSKAEFALARHTRWGDEYEAELSG